MHKFQLRLLFGLAIAFMLPVMAMAAPPPPASGITATMENGTVHVRWEGIEDQANARIYWSYISILENNGEYDDYAVVEGNATDYVITDPPAVDTLYVSVILENTDGEASPFFTEEASVKLSSESAEEFSSVMGEESSSSSSSFSSTWESSALAIEESSSSTFMIASSAAASSTATVPTDGKFHLTSAAAPSANQVIVTFSHTVVMNPNDAARAFTIATADGRALALLRLELLGEHVTITTDTQERGVPYVVTAGSVVQGVQLVDGQQAPVLLGNLVESTTFTGNPFGKEPVVPIAGKGFTLNATSIGGGLYRVETLLGDIPHDGVARYDVYQSLDGGRSFSGPQTVDANAPSIRVEGVAPGAFVMTLQPVAADGSPRQALTASVILGNGMSVVVASSSATPIASTVSSSWSSSKSVTHSPSTALPGSGAGIVTLLGAGSAWTMIRLRKKNSLDE